MSKITIGIGEQLAVESSNLRSITLLEQDEIGLCEVEVAFAKASYIYHDVDEETLDEFVNADSKGRFLRSNIIGTYEATKVEVDEPTEAA